MVVLKEPRAWVSVEAVPGGNAWLMGGAPEGRTEPRGRGWEQADFT